MNIGRHPRMTLKPSDRDTFIPEIDFGDALRNVFRKLLRHWVFIAASVMSAVLVITAYILLSTALFTANGSILIDPRVGQNPSGDAPAIPGLQLSDALIVDSELLVLTSREVTSRTVQALGLEVAQPSGPNLRRRLVDFFGLETDDAAAVIFPDEMKEARRIEALRRDFMRNMEVVRSGGSFVIDISYTAADPQFAAKAVNTLISEYQRQASRQQNADIERNQVWLSSRIETLRAEVELGETTITEFRNENQLQTSNGQLLPTEIALNAAVAQLIQLQSDAVALDVKIGQIAEQIAVGNIGEVQIPAGEASSALASFETRYAELQQSEQELLVQWDESTPIVQNLRKEMRKMRELVIGEYRGALSRLDASAETIKRQIVATRNVIAGLREQYAGESRRSVILRNLEREAEAKQELYARLLEDYNSASQLLTFDASPARVIAWAVPPDKKSSPKSRQLMVLAIFGALVLATSAIFLFEALDGSFRSQQAVTSSLGLRFLGMIPDFSSEKDGSGHLLGLIPGGPLRRPGRWQDLKRDARWLDFAAFSPKSFTADTLAMLQSQLAMARKADAVRDGGQIVGFTSSVMSEGKTTTAANFAIFLARRNERVVLVDFDLITYDLSSLLAPILPAANSLSALITDPVGGCERLALIEELPGLTVIGNAGGQFSGSVTRKNAEMLAGVLDELRKHFDHIIVDLPPAQGTADTQTLAAMCDRLIYVIQWGSTPRAQVANALQQRGIDKDSIFGILFTKAPLRRYRAYTSDDANDYYR